MAVSSDTKSVSFYCFPAKKMCLCTETVDIQKNQIHTLI